jgi:hypothetical protein
MKKRKETPQEKYVNMQEYFNPLSEAPFNQHGIFIFALRETEYYNKVLNTTTVLA